MCYSIYCIFLLHSLQTGSSNNVKILVENAGRVNYGTTLDNQRKGTVMALDYKHREIFPNSTFINFYIYLKILVKILDCFCQYIYIYHIFILLVYYRYSWLSKVRWRSIKQLENIFSTIQWRLGFKVSVLVFLYSARHLMMSYLPHWYKWSYSDAILQLLQSILESSVYLFFLFIYLFIYNKYLYRLAMSKIKNIYT